MSTADIYEQVFENNKKWVTEKLSQDPHFFTNLSKEQNPDFLFIGCSDSRVPDSEITGLEPGNIFVHRNIANVIDSTDMNVQSVIQYAVENLEVKHIIVCGHYGCGGIKAAMQPKDMGLLNGWLRNIRDVYRLHLEELNAINDEGSRYKRLVELNVQEQCVHAIKIACVQKNYRKRGYPTVHGWVYDLKNGQLVDLKLDFEKILSDIEQIYHITE